MEALHPQIAKLKRATAGQFLTCRYDVEGVDFTTRAKRANLGPNQIEAYVALFGVRDSYGTVAMRGCFAKSIQERGPESKGNEKIIHLFYHNILDPVGRLIEMEEDEIGLRVIIEFDQTQRAQDIYDMTVSKTIRQYSYGFDYVWDKMKYDEKTKNILMYECAVYETSSITIRSSNPAAATIRSVEDFNAKIESLGELSEAAVRSLSRSQRMELKQLFSEYRALALRAKPEENPLPITKPTLGGYDLSDYLK